MTRKNALIILILVAVLAGLYVLYLIFFSDSTQQNTPTDPPRELGSFFPITETETRGSDQDPFNGKSEPEIVDPTNVPKLRQISSVPVSGAVVFERLATTTKIIDGQEQVGTSTETVFRYIERSTGHIYETTSTNLSTPRITNTSIPKNYIGQFSNNGENIIITTLEGFKKTFLGKIKLSEDKNSAGTIEGEFFGEEAEEIKINKNQIVYSSIKDDVKYGSKINIFVSPLTNPTPKNIFSHPMFEWTVDWVDDQTIGITSKPSFFAPGYYYEVKTNGGAPTKIIEEVFGLNTKANSDYVVYSKSSRNKIESFVYDKENKTSNKLPLSTLPNEKCVFGTNDLKTIYCAVPLPVRGEALPDAWYLGEISFQDSFYKIDLEKQQSTVLSLNDLVGFDFDVQKIYISPKNDFLLFINKKDLTLWSLDIK